MANFLHDTAVSAPEILLLNQTGLIGPNGVLFTNAATPVTMNASSELLVLGAIATLGDRAVNATAAANTTITIGADGKVSAGLGGVDAAAITFVGATIFNLTNAGVVTGHHHAVRAVEADNSVVLMINNSGQLLSSFGSCVLVDPGQSRTHFFNSGLVQSTDGPGVEAINGTLKLNNTGTIIGDLMALSCGNDNDSIVSSGEIVGDIKLNGGVDVAVLSGSFMGTLSAGSGNDTISVRDLHGDVTVSGGAGDDTFRTDDGAIEFVETLSQGTDRVISYAESYSLADHVEHLFLRAGALEGYGNSLNNSIEGNARANVLAGEAGDDSLAGFAGRDHIQGDDGNDSISGGNGDDSIFGGSGNDNINGNDGDDQIFGNNGDDQIFASLGNDNLFGLKGNDVLAGSEGADSIFGGSGGDFITGGDGSDILSGGTGADQFAYQVVTDSDLNEGTDTINGFTLGVDKINLSFIDANGASAGDPAFVFIGGAAFNAEGQVRFTVQGADVVVEVNQTGTSVAEMFIRLSGLASIAVTDFIL